MHLTLNEHDDDDDSYRIECEGTGYSQLVRDSDQRWALCIIMFHICWIIAGPFEQLSASQNKPFFLEFELRCRRASY